MEHIDSGNPPSSGKNGSARVETAANNDLPAGTPAQRPRTLLTPAVQRVIAWHQQRISARHGGVEGPG